jgi:hypothetical protein
MSRKQKEGSRIPTMCKYAEKSNKMGLVECIGSLNLEFIQWNDGIRTELRNELDERH